MTRRGRMTSSSYVMPVFLLKRKTRTGFSSFFFFSIVDGASGSRGDTSLGMRDKLVNETKREKDESVPWRGRRKKHYMNDATTPRPVLIFNSVAPPISFAWRDPHQDPAKSPTQNSVDSP